MRRVSQWSVVSSSVFCFALCAMLFGLCVSADAQQPKKVPRIGYLTLRPGPFDHDKIFKQELHDLGWIDGQNITIEYRWAAGKSGPPARSCKGTRRP